MAKYNYSVVSKEVFDINCQNPDARIAVVGISPGPAQLEKNDNISDLKERNRVCAFANGKDKHEKDKKEGTRTNLVAMLNHLGVDKALGIKDCKSLWEENFDMALFTSILPYSVVRFNGQIKEKIEKGEEEYLKEKENQYKKSHKNNVSGFFISKISYSAIKNNKQLTKNFEHFVKTINESTKLEYIFVLGTAFDVLMKAIDKPISGCEKIKLDKKKIIRIPHAAGSNIGQINAFLYASREENKKPKNDATTQVLNGIKLFKEAKEKME